MINLKDLLVFNKEVIVELFDDNIQGYYYSKIVEYNNDFITMSIPFEDDYLITIWKHSKIKVTIEINNEIYSFYSVVTDTNYNINKTFTVKYPDSITNKDQRKDIRLEHPMFLDIEYKSMDVNFKGVSINISNQGLRFLSTIYVPEDEILNLSFSINFNEFNIKAKVTNHFEKRYGVNECGVQFLDFDGIDFKFINEFILKNFRKRNLSYRKSFRLKVDIDSTALVYKNNKIDNCHIKIIDISSNGISFLSGRNLEDSDKILLNFKINNQYFENIPVKLVRYTKDKDLCIFGSVFHNILEDDKQKITKIIINYIDEKFKDRIHKVEVICNLPCSINTKSKMERVLGILKKISLDNYVIQTSEELTLNENIVIAYKFDNLYLNHITASVFKLLENKDDKFLYKLKLNELLSNEKDLILSYILKNHHFNK